LTVERHFSTRLSGGEGAGNGTLLAVPLGFLNWRFGLNLELQLGPYWDGYGMAGVASPRGGYYTFVLSNGLLIPFTSANYPLPSTDYRLEFVGTLPGNLAAVKTAKSNWIVRDRGDRTWYLETFLNPQTNNYDIARPLRMVEPGGLEFTYTYAGYDALLSIADSKGRELMFEWQMLDSQPRAIARIILPDGTALRYIYQAIYPLSPDIPERLARVERQDAAGAVLDKTDYDYGDARFPLAVTGIRDKNGTLRWSVTYDDLGRALSSSGPSGVEASSVAYGATGTTFTRTVTGPLGKSTVYNFTRAGTSYDIKLASVVEQVSPNSPSRTESMTYGTDQFLATTTDGEARVTGYTRDAKGRPTQVVEAQGTPQARATSITWHAAVSSPTQVVQPGLTTNYTYAAGTSAGPPPVNVPPAGGDPNSAHAYWRVSVGSLNGGSGTAISSLYFFAQQGGDDLATGGLIMASASTAGGPASKAFDHDSTTDWRGVDGSGSWIGYQFASPVMIKFVGVGASPDANLLPSAPRSFSVDYSDNGQSWTTLWYVSNPSPWSTREVRYFTAPGFSYTGSLHGARPKWRLQLLASGAGAYSAAEAQFRSTPGGANQAVGGTAFATQEYSWAYDASKAFDNSASTLWGSSNKAGEQVLQYTFASSVSVGEFALIARNDSDAPQTPTRASVEYWSSGLSAWVTAWQYSTSDFTAGQTKTFADPRYVAP
jgi:hypothetical protein